MKRLAIVILLVTCAAAMNAQAPTAPPPAYVASPIRKTVDDISRRTSFTPTGLTMAGGTIRSIFALAYPSEGADPIGAPDWMSAEFFDLVVRFEGMPTLAERQAIFREIFATQLKLKAHYERRDTPVYHLVVARSDGRLGKSVKKLDVDCDALRDRARKGEQIPPMPPAANGTLACQSKVGNGTVLSGGMRFAQLASTVRNPAGRLIIDKTGLDGFYEFTFEWASGSPSAAGAPDERPNIFTAFQEQLGLKLEPATAPVEVVVIDHIERPPQP
jgi:uncharacterized protein (TIGR03435 family)